MPHPFEYVAPTEESVLKIRKVRDAMKELHDLLLATIPTGAERTLAVRKLEESSMWANKAIVFGQVYPEPPGHPLLAPTGPRP